MRFQRGKRSCLSSFTDNSYKFTSRQSELFAALPESISIGCRIFFSRFQKGSRYMGSYGKKVLAVAARWQHVLGTHHGGRQTKPDLL